MLTIIIIYLLNMNKIKYQGELIIKVTINNCNHVYMHAQMQSRLQTL